MVKKDKLTKDDQNFEGKIHFINALRGTPLHALLANPSLTQMTDEINNVLEQTVIGR